jgi:hypothetical protein
MDPSILDDGALLASFNQGSQIADSIKKILDANQVSNHGEHNLIEQFQFSGGSGLELGCHCR